MRHPLLSLVRRNPRARRWLPVLVLAAVGADAQERPAELTPVVVSATRAARPADRLPVTVDLWSAEELAQHPGLTVDDILKDSAAFSLFRRTGSLMANPTAQGVSLRNLGPSGAGRSLVLLDGVPLNDPFGGWVTWTKLPRLTLGGAEIVRGGGSSAWGSAALGGTVQLLSNPTPPSPAVVEVHAGDFSTRSAEVLAAAGGFSVAARAFATDGFWRVGRADRGDVDRRTDHDHQLVQAEWQGHIGAVEGGATARFFREDRGNGTPLQRNRTREAFFSGELRGDWAGGGVWESVAYFQTQEFSNVFSSVSDDRNSENPALDQYAVPADAAGAAFSLTLGDDRATTTLGADGRWVQGETREAFFLQNGVFSRRRFAGGEQGFVGAFVQHDRELSARWHLNLGARVDGWQNRDGHRREIDLATGAVLRDERMPHRDGVEFSPRVGLSGRVADQVRVRGSLYQAFRVPTLNELYRPFRVGNVITEANPALAVETLDGAEAALVLGDARRGVSVTGFYNELHDAVANVTLGAGPGQVPGVGFVPEGGLGRQRRNLATVRVRGLEFSGHWRPVPQLELRADYLYSDARVLAADPPAEQLGGNRLAQVPEHTLIVGASWREGPWSMRVQARHLSEAFEDDANTLALAAATTVDLRLARRVGAAGAGEVFVSVENLFDETIEAGRDADGRVDLGQPRFTHGGIRWRW